MEGPCCHSARLAVDQAGVQKAIQELTVDEVNRAFNKYFGDKAFVEIKVADPEPPVVEEGEEAAATGG